MRQKCLSVMVKNHDVQPHYIVLYWDKKINMKKTNQFEIRKMWSDNTAILHFRRLQLNIYFGGNIGLILWLIEVDKNPSMQRNCGFNADQLLQHMLVCAHHNMVSMHIYVTVHSTVYTNMIYHYLLLSYNIYVQCVRTNMIYQYLLLSYNIFAQSVHTNMIYQYFPLGTTAHVWTEPWACCSSAIRDTSQIIFSWRYKWKLPQY